MEGGDGVGERGNYTLMMMQWIYFGVLRDDSWTIADAALEGRWPGTAMARASGIVSSVLLVVSGDARGRRVCVIFGGQDPCLEEAGD
jgi:hypothetical protein